MPTKRVKRVIRRRASLADPDELWKAGRYVEAAARDEYCEFRHVDHCLSYEERCQAADLRAEREAQAAAGKRRVRR